jgi:hypothetical protein
LAFFDGSLDVFLRGVAEEWSQARRKGFAPPWNLRGVASPVRAKLSPDRGAKFIEPLIDPERFDAIAVRLNVVLNRSSQGDTELVRVHGRSVCSTLPRPNPIFENFRGTRQTHMGVISSTTSIQVFGSIQISHNKSRLLVFGPELAHVYLDHLYVFQTKTSCNRRELPEATAPRIFQRKTYTTPRSLQDNG